MSVGRPGGDPRPPAVFLLGPTASGKTELAVELAERLPLEIVSVDSALVYRGLDIGAARPDAVTLARAPHHLLDLADPAEPYSAGRFREDALAAMAGITARGRVPLLAGGTMMYVQALTRGLAPMPPSDAQVRARLAEELEDQGSAVLHAELAAVDPEAAQRIHPNDPQRIQRALEVYRISGRPISSYHTHARNRGDALGYRTLHLALAPAKRPTLHARIERRFRQMLADGLLDEVAGLLAQPGVTADCPAMRAVGYRQIAEHLAGQVDYDTMVDHAITATRQLAKRQLTWLRGMEAIEWYDSESAPLDAITARIRRYMAEGTTDEHG
ncbi:MAG: tRNA (adenosine(37)-N6)-dimethylallyltransferase MiaA [Halofilum sp. (in: g-proteobacteria)]